MTNVSQGSTSQERAQQVSCKVHSRCHMLARIWGTQKIRRSDHVSYVLVLNFSRSGFPWKTAVEAHESAGCKQGPPKRLKSYQGPTYLPKEPRGPSWPYLALRLLRRLGVIWVLLTHCDQSLLELLPGLGHEVRVVGLC